MVNFRSLEFFVTAKSVLSFPVSSNRCGSETLPQNFTCSENKEIIGKVTLCGNPAPKLTWTIGGKRINGMIDSSKANQYQYTYSFNTTLKFEMCGKVLKYEAIGYKNIKTTGNSTILMSDDRETHVFLVILNILGHNTYINLKYFRILKKKSLCMP